MDFNNINAERARHGMTIDELARKIGTTRRTYYSWKKSGNVPASKLIAMARLFECSTDYLLGLSAE